MQQHTLLSTCRTAEKGNATIVHNNLSKMVSLLEDSGYKYLKRDPTLSYSRNTTELIKNSGLAEVVVKNQSV